jgi:formylglycine-generating enzyme required for sulfatase activity
MMQRRQQLIGMSLAACAAAIAGWSLAHAPARRARALGHARTSCMATTAHDEVVIPGGSFVMGADDAYPEEGPRHRVTVADFRIDRHEVTNAEFAQFVAATGYVTVAERRPDPALNPGIDPAKLVAGSAVFVYSKRDAAQGGEWRFVPGASWRAPDGPGSSVRGRGNYPVVHIAYQDALAYAKWRGRRLPTEAEWERAARGGHDAAPYVWGKELAPGGKWRANVWQGAFPIADTGADGFIGIAPVGCFETNDYGLYDMIGNVWEWTADTYGARAEVGVIKGGSYLCSDDYCARYRASARQPMQRDFSAGHVGFRTVASP